MPEVIGLHVPKFREVSRLTDWVRRRGCGSRLPVDREQIFFKSAVKDPKNTANELVKYSRRVGPVGEELEELLLCSPDCIMSYGENISRIPWDRRLPLRLQLGLGADFSLILRLARHLRARVPAELEMSILCLDNAPSKIVEYAQVVGPLDGDLERAICDKNDQIIRYGNILKMHERKLPVWMTDCLKGDSDNLFHLARLIGGRLPKDLEDTIGEPEALYQYAKNVVRSRLPEHLELVFMKNHRVACRYAFEVVRGWSNVRLPDELHSMIVMKSFESPNDMEIKRYVLETERVEGSPTQIP